MWTHRITSTVSTDLGKLSYSLTDGCDQYKARIMLFAHYPFVMNHHNAIVKRRSVRENVWLPSTYSTKHVFMTLAVFLKNVQTEACSGFFKGSLCFEKCWTAFCFPSTISVLASFNALSISVSTGESVGILCWLSTRYISARRLPEIECGSKSIPCGTFFIGGRALVGREAFAS